MEVNKIKIYREIENNLILDNKPFVIGINGVDTSGKTSFSLELKDYLEKRNFSVQIIHVDDFHHPSKLRKQGNNPVDAYIENAFDLKSLEDDLLKDIKTGKQIDKQLKLLNLNTDQYDCLKHYKIDKNTIVIIEGVLLYREPINQYFNYRIYLDISFEEVLKRAKIRDVPKYGVNFLEKYKTKYIPVQEKYIRLHQPKEMSHLVIDYTFFNYPKIIKNNMS